MDGGPGAKETTGTDVEGGPGGGSPLAGGLYFTMMYNPPII